MGLFSLIAKNMAIMSSQEKDKSPERSNDSADETQKTFKTGGLFDRLAKDMSTTMKKRRGTSVEPSYYKMHQAKKRRIERGDNMDKQVPQTWLYQQGKLEHQMRVNRYKDQSIEKIIELIEPE
jgi:hypothetical protein